MIKKTSILLILFTFLLLLFIPTASASEADRFGLPTEGNQTVINSSNMQITWINWSEFEVVFNGRTQDPVRGVFVGIDPFDDDIRKANSYIYELEGWNCDQKNVYRPRNSDGATVLVDIDFRNTDLVDCENTTENTVDVSTTNPRAANTYFNWVDSGTIETLGLPDSRTYSQSTSDPNIFLRTSESGDGNCQDRLVVNRENDSLRFYELDGSYGGNTPSSAGTDCDYNENSLPQGNTEVFIRNVDGAKALAAGTGTGSSGSSGSVDPTCESEGGAFGWVLCPILEWASKALEIVEGWITNKLEVPSGYYDNDGVRGAWANIRNIAYILLIPVMLLMVISTALGFNLFDAYTVKRALPRLFIAIIFIALSYELTTLLVEITNIVGKGVAGLIAAPFGGSQALTLQAIFNPNNVDSGLIVGGGVILAGLAIGGAVFVISLGILASYLLVAALAMLSIFFLLILRQILIIALIIAAPIAILSWIFPGNDKMWKIWWQTFSKLLLLYPIIVAAIVIGRAFASIVATSETAGVDTFLSIIVIITAYIAPFFLIPTVFRYAGGAFANIAGIVNNRSKGVFDRQRKYRSTQKKQNWDRRGRSRVVQKRADWQNRLQTSASKGGFVRRKTLNSMASAVGGYNAQADDAERRAVVNKRIGDQTATGRDDEVRALTVNRKSADASTTTTQGALVKQADGSMIQAGLKEDEQKVRVTDEGVRQYRTLGGAWVDSAAVDSAYKRWGNDTYAQQSALSYEMKKALTVGDHQRISRDYGTLATEAWGQNENQAGGTWIGAAYENQGEKLEFKHTNWQSGKVNAKKFSQELYEKRGSYQMSQMTANNFEILEKEYVEAQQSGDTQTQQQIQAIAETFMSRMGDTGGIQGMDGDQPIIQPQQPMIIPQQQGQQQNTTPNQTQQPVQREIYRTNAAGPAHTAEAIRKLAVTTGVYGPQDPSTDTRSNQSNINQPRQN